MAEGIIHEDGLLSCQGYVCVPASQGVLGALIPMKIADAVHLLHHCLCKWSLYRQSASMYVSWLYIVLLHTLQCSFMEYKNYKVVYRRYASLYVIMGVDGEEVSKSQFSLEHCHALGLCMWISLKCQILPKIAYYSCNAVHFGSVVLIECCNHYSNM